MKFLLAPFGVLYFLITTIRNFLYDREIWIFKPESFDVNTICIGNITVGGTGKSPHVEYLINLFKDKLNIATLSRGYGRKTRGFIIANEHTKAEEIGDEPKQFLRKFGHKIKVIVGEERALAIPKLLYTHPSTQLILLDDAFQHRKVKCDLNILLIDFNRPLFKDYILPIGRLRESRSGAKRADIIIITKCPAKIGYEMDYFKIKLKRYINPGTPFFFTGLKYGVPIPVNHNERFDKEYKVISVAGIANPTSFEEYLKADFKFISSIRFKDHHLYQDEDFAKIIANSKLFKEEQICVVTTEKDMVKWVENPAFALLKEIKVYYLPIQIYFLKDEDVFHDLLFNVVK